MVRLAFAVDDWSGHAAIALVETPDGSLLGEIATTKGANKEQAIAQARRVLSLDHDGAGYAALGKRDRLIGRLQRESGYLRPVLFHSPYEQACWAVISSRIRQSQAAKVRDAIAKAHGAKLEVGGERMLAFPGPEQLLSVYKFEGLADTKLDRLHGIARAALAGHIDARKLRSLPHEEAVAELRTLPGVGAFWADGIVVRGVGDADALTLREPRVREKAAALYQRPEVTTDDQAFLKLADGWRPWRSWVSVLLRAAA
ncbi:MAG: Fe-S cluster assembly protein HesB [Solirubrobacterales bacterium]|nr:Fe-S cluster assembly protein HesB [Solirubrobacterales bacterium]